MVNYHELMQNVSDAFLDKLQSAEFDGLKELFQHLANVKQTRTS